AADAQLLRQVGLNQALSRRDGLPHQRVAQLAVGACRDRLRALDPAEPGGFHGAGHTALPRLQVLVRHALFSDTVPSGVQTRYWRRQWSNGRRSGKAFVARTAPT